MLEQVKYIPDKGIDHVCLSELLKDQPNES